MTWKRVLFLFVLSALVPFATVTACGPDFEPDVFVRRLRPDRPTEFAEGKLGLLLPSFPRADLIVAYRYLNGGRLDAEEQKAYQPTFGIFENGLEQRWKDEAKQRELAAEPIRKWLALRGQSGRSSPDLEKEVRRQAEGIEFFDRYNNCNSGAFRVALLTYTNRAAAWGERSRETADWLNGQDAVFDNCSGGGAHLPDPVPPSAPELLKQDRDYQIAAARFYAGNFEDARKGFEAIHQNSKSPWRALAGYLVARCLVRQAFLSAPQSDGMVASFDSRLMAQAAEVLNSLLKENLPASPVDAIHNELDLVRIRIEPEKRVREISEGLAGPMADVKFKQHLSDLVWYLDTHNAGLAIRDDSEWGDVSEVAHSASPDPTDQQKKRAFEDGFRDAGKSRDSAELVDWLLTFQSPADNAKDHAIARWRKTRSIVWLLSALSKAHAVDAPANDLVAAAAELAAESPAWETVTYHRARLLIESGKEKEAGTLIESALSHIAKSGRDSSVNAYEALKIHAAANLDQFLTLAPRKVLLKTSQAYSANRQCLEVMENPKRQYDCLKQIGEYQFSLDAADFFNQQAPLDVLVSAAESDRLPPELRTSVALMAWTRSILLKDEAAAKHLFPLLPEKIQKEAGSGIGFRALVTIVRNPGLQPFLNDGIQRNYSYDFVESYRNNWWCEGWQKPPESLQGYYPALYRGPVSFLTLAQRKAAEKEVGVLTSQGEAQLYLGGMVIAYAKDNLQDPGVPEALYLVLRMARYSCDTWAQTPAEKARAAKEETMVRQAASLLWRNYPTSPWTEKARPFGPGKS